jgi:hypothetical protein
MTTILRLGIAGALTLGLCGRAAALEPVLVAETIAGANGSRLTDFSVGLHAGQPVLYFQATAGSFPDVTSWISDGTAAGTRQLVAATTTSIAARPDDRAYVVYQHPGEHSFLASVASDGTATPLIDFGATNPYATGWIARPDLQSRSFVLGTDGSLWRTDGSVAGTVKLATGVREVAVGRDYAFFEAGDGSLKRVDATTTTVTDMGRTSDHWYDAHRLAPVGDGVCMKELTVGDDWTAHDLYCSKGATVSVEPVSPTGPGTRVGLYDNVAFTHVGDHAVFMAADLRPWTTDGTSAGTAPLASEKLNGPPNAFASTGRLAYFFTECCKLWVTDGATATLVATTPYASIIAPYYENPVPEVGGRAFFVANIGGAHELVAAGDGPVEGMFVVPAPAGYTGWEVTESVAKLGSTIIFSARTNETGEELWSYGPIDVFASGFE